MTSTQKQSPLSALVYKSCVYRVIGNEDPNEGRGRRTVIGYFLERAEAERAAKGSYVMGSDCPIEAEECTLVEIVDSGKLYRLGSEIVIRYEDPREVRRRALAKLSPEEREALGFLPGEPDR